MSETNITYRKLEEKDWKQVLEIYKQGIETGDATFETNTPDWIYWNKNHIDSCRIIAEIDTKVIGWAAISAVSSRKVYAGVAEVSVYVSTKFSGKKIGSTLLEKLINESEKNGIWTLQSSIFRENIPSLKIHKKLGFRKIGYREKVGKMNETWRDTVLLERRSSKVGIE